MSDAFPGQQLEKRIDSYSFKNITNSFGVMCSTPTDKYCHTVKAETSTIDFDYLLRSAKKVAVACEVFIN